MAGSGTSGSGTSGSGTSGSGTGGSGTGGAGTGATGDGAEGLFTSEGVDEGSAASTQEQAHPGAEQDGLLGEPPRGAPVDGAQAAGPVDMESAQAREARGVAPGQQLQEGEG